MRIALLDAEKTRSVLKRLIRDYHDIHIAVAWGYNGKLADLLMENSGKFHSVTFGLNGFATSPDLVERLIGTKERLHREGGHRHLPSQALSVSGWRHRAGDCWKRQFHEGRAG